MECLGMRKVMLAGCILACSLPACADMVHINQMSLKHLRDMCSAVLAQVQPVEMMWVKDFRLQEEFNRENQIVLGLDVASINPRNEADVHVCHYDLDVMPDGTPNIHAMFVDRMQVNITVNPNAPLPSK
jgi:hypothetical protein